MNIKTTRPSSKLAQQHYGPFEVLCQINETSYELKLPHSWHLKHPVFHQNLLSLHRPGHSPQQLATPHNPPSSLNNSGNKVYDVETIANSRKAGKSKGRIEYLVKWLDYGEEENTWKPGLNLNNSYVQELIAAFHASHPNVFRPGRRVRTLTLKEGVMSWDVHFPSLYFFLSSLHLYPAYHDNCHLSMQSADPTNFIFPFGHV